MADQTALHHAAQNNKLDVVKYLLDMGVKDTCMKCDGSFYWLKSEMHRLQSRVRKTTIFSDVFNDIQEYAVVSYGKLLDDEHLIYCETALHTAISSGHNKVVMELISEDKSALTCQDHSGRTRLHEAARRNNREIVTILLKEDQTEVESTCDYEDYQYDSFYGNLLIMSDAELMEYKKINALVDTHLST